MSDASSRNGTNYRKLASIRYVISNHHQKDISYSKGESVNTELMKSLMQSTTSATVIFFEERITEDG